MKDFGMGNRDDEEDEICRSHAPDKNWLEIVGFKQGA